MNKICLACNGRIKEKKERYVHIEDFNKGKLENDSWWHLDCFKKAMNRDLNELDKLNYSFLKKGKHIIDSLPDEFKGDSVYEI